MSDRIPTRGGEKRESHLDHSKPPFPDSFERRAEKAADHCCDSPDVDLGMPIPVDSPQAVVDKLPEKTASTTRLEALSDGMFAVALTLLILDIRVPDVDGPTPDVAVALLVLLPKILIYLLSYLIVGFVWTWHNVMFSLIARSTRHLMWINLFLLLPVAFLPFATALVSRYPDSRWSVVVYGGNVIILSVMFNILWTYARRQNLVDERLHGDIVHYVTRRNALFGIRSAAAAAAGVIYPHFGLFCFALIPLFYFVTGGRHASSVR